MNVKQNFRFFFFWVQAYIPSKGMKRKNCCSGDMEDLFLKANLIIVRIPTVFPRVNKMLGRVGKLVESLDAERKTLEEKLQRLQTSEEDKVEQSSKEKHLVSH